MLEGGGIPPHLSGRGRKGRSRVGGHKRGTRDCRGHTRQRRHSPANAYAPPSGPIRQSKSRTHQDHRNTWTCGPAPADHASAVRFAGLVSIGPGHPHSRHRRCHFPFHGCSGEHAGLRMGWLAKEVAVVAEALPPLPLVARQRAECDYPTAAAAVGQETRCRPQSLHPQQPPIRLSATHRGWHTPGGHRECQAGCPHLRRNAGSAPRADTHHPAARRAWCHHCMANPPPPCLASPPLRQCRVVPRRPERCRQS
mmetsp:Transcript_4522/g.11569  ORF Transcript_4522/g.11569 Transcript_4522/m.11569 type:complete len:253 (-) Transcript_4522:671-1429(-)